MSDTLLNARNLKRHFIQNDDLTDFVVGTTNVLKAVDGVSFEIQEGETFGLVGESGCGKSTLARTILGIHPPTEGDIFFQGTSITNATKSERKKIRQNIQFIFQDPSDSLNPRMTAGEIIAEPLKIHDWGTEQERRDRINHLLREVGMSEGDAQKYPHQFSGGQKQRIGIARALALKPDLIIADEPVSSLDMSEQSRILKLLNRIQEDRSVSYLFIAHDLNVVRQISDRVAVMYLGKIVETAETESLFNDPRHPYTSALLSTIPPANPTENWEPTYLDETKIPDPVDPPDGCNFCTRCPAATEKCFDEEPPLTPPSEGLDRKSACFYPYWNENA